VKKIESKVTYEIKGLNQERAFNKLTKEVTILTLERKDKHISVLEVAPKDAKKTRKFLRNNNFEILSEKSQGPYLWRKRFLSCYGIILGLALVIVGYLAQINVIWQIKVFGNDKLAASEITAFIEENMGSRFISQFNTKQMEIKLKDNFERISSVSVAIIGQSVVVNVHESLLPDEMTTIYQPIVSEYDCMITKIELIQGTLAIKEGQIIRKGQVLVEPYIIDSQGEKRDVKPMAKIEADVWVSGESEHRDSYYKRYRTGNKVEESDITLFGLVIYSHKAELKFSEYELEEKSENLNKNILLPFKINKKTYYETKTELIEREFSEVEQEKIKEAKEKALLYLEEYEIIKAENVTIKSSAGVHIVTVTITVSREIGGV